MVHFQPPRSKPRWAKSMAKSGQPQDPEAPGKPSNAEELSTLESPVSINKPTPSTSAPKVVAKPSAPAKPPVSPPPSVKSSPPPKPSTSKPPVTRVDPDAIHTLDSAVALKTPMYGVSSEAKQTPPADNGTFFGDATFGGTPTTPPQESGDFDTIGPYWLVKMLGEGGMGQVWLAEQTFPVKRKVALKLIKGGRYDKSVIQRFEAERQSLAIMDHPAIAKVFDAGTTSEGQPFFVMEYVPGSPITKYCDEKRLSTRQRLELFIKVCEGVQHAHQKAMIHRDLKPGNILVSEIDGKPAPHIIDFGIAKATENKQEGETLLTQAGMLVGTPGYMAPEQTDPTFPDIDTRADVYALGVILYELLTGSLPFDPKQWQKQPLYEVLRRIREDDPPAPSTQLIKLNDTAAANAGLRQTEPRQLASLLKGDLDWITMKALEKDRARRYDSPTSLAADITRYLTDEPVLASPPSVSYRTSKFIKRHRVGVLAATVVFVMLIALAVSMTVQAYRIARERDRANREAAEAKNVSDFLDSSLQCFRPQRGSWQQHYRTRNSRSRCQADRDQPNRSARGAGAAARNHRKRLRVAGTLSPIPEASGEICQTSPPGAWTQESRAIKFFERPGSRSADGRAVKQLRRSCFGTHWQPIAAR